MKQSTRIIINSAASFGQQGFLMLLQVFLLAFILRRVDSEAYGVVLLTAGLQAMMFLVRDAISVGVVTKVSQACQQGDTDKMNRIVSSSVFFLLVVGIVACAVVAVAAPAIADFFEVRKDLHQTMIWVIVLSGLDVVLMFPWFPYRAVLEAHQRYGWISINTMLFDLLRAAIIVVTFLVWGGNILFVAGAMVLTDFGRQASMALVAYRVVPGLRVGLHLFDRAVLASLVAFGSYLVYTSVVAVGAGEAVKWLIGRLLTLEFVTFLTIAVFVPSAVRRVVQTMTMVLVPVASRYHAAEDPLLGELFVRGTRYAAVISLGLAACLLPVAGPLISLWLGADKGWIGPYAMLAGSIAAVTIPQECAQQVLNGMGDSRRPFLAVLAAGLVTVVLLAALVGIAKWAMLGAVLAEALGLVTRWLLMSRFAFRSIGVRARTVAVHAYLQPFAAAFLAAAVGAAANYYWPVQTWLGLATNGSLAGLVFLAAFVPFLSKPEWKMARSAVQVAARVLSGTRGRPTC